MVFILPSLKRFFCLRWCYWRGWTAGRLTAVCSGCRAPVVPTLLERETERERERSSGVHQTEVNIARLRNAFAILLRYLLKNMVAVSRVMSLVKPCGDATVGSGARQRLISYNKRTYYLYSFLEHSTKTWTHDVALIYLEEKLFNLRVKFEFLETVQLTTAAFWDLTTYSLATRYRRFGGICLHLQDRIICAYNLKNSYIPQKRRYIVIWQRIVCNEISTFQWNLLSPSSG